ncbi:hypothetical protein KKE06_00215 [Candidatus Micrarchaeota archaeon]|nr:hypothetical protein [Candidatus Micrarchaeota archaeon]MBU1930917.1 hypothetical protein [Candidatus Micrarchaeota archaeon]
MSRRNKRVKRIRTIRKHKPKTGKSKASKKRCALSKSVLHGTTHGKRIARVRKLSKTQKRPTGIFGGILNSKERKHVIEEAIKVKLGIKTMDGVSLKERNFVEQALQQLEKKK